jgi:dTMP kinase
MFDMAEAVVDRVAATPSALHDGGLCDPALQRRATVVVVEGIDGSGKTTLGRRIAETFSALGRPTTWYPNRNLAPVRAVLDAAAVERGFPDRRAMLGRDQTQLLAALLKFRDMLDLAEEMGRPDTVMVIDRYCYTHLALAAEEGTTNGPRLRRLYAELPRPGTVLFLDVTPEVALERVIRRNIDRDSIEYLRRFSAAYRALPEMGSVFTVIDADQDEETVFRQAWAAVEADAGGFDGSPGPV